MAYIMTTKELCSYLKLHEITICKYTSEGQIPAIRIGRVWRFDKDVIDDWIRKGQNETKAEGEPKILIAKKKRQKEYMTVFMNGNQKHFMK